MIRLTKIFHFETAHAIHGYPGDCKNIHGHSYELHVTVCANKIQEAFIPAPGFIMDFKEIKKIVTNVVIESFDHKLVLSRNFLAKNPSFKSPENLVVWDAEPTAENMLINIKQTLCENFPDDVKLVHLKLFETKNSYAEWINGDTFNG